MRLAVGVEMEIPPLAGLARASHSFWPCLGLQAVYRSRLSYRVQKKSAVVISSYPKLIIGFVIPKLAPVSHSLLFNKFYSTCPKSWLGKLQAFHPCSFQICSASGSGIAWAQDENSATGTFWHKQCILQCHFPWPLRVSRKWRDFSAIFYS